MGARQAGQHFGRAPASAVAPDGIVALFGCALGPPEAAAALQELLVLLLRPCEIADFLQLCHHCALHPQRYTSWQNK